MAATSLPGPALSLRMPALASRPQKIAFAEMRAFGVRALLTYRSDYHCSHWTAISGDLGRVFTCRACGRRARFRLCCRCPLGAQ